MITAGIPTVFVNAADLGYDGTELQAAINEDRAALAKLEAIRVAGALRMGLIQAPEEALKRQHTPKVAFVAPAQDYVSSSGKTIAAGDIALNVRALSMGKLHHAMMGTASVAIATVSYTHLDVYKRQTYVLHPVGRGHAPDVEGPRRATRRPRGAEEPSATWGRPTDGCRRWVDRGRSLFPT